MSKNEEERASRLSCIFFVWVFPLLKRGASQIIQESDLFSLRSHETCDQLVEQVKKCRENEQKEQKSKQTLFDIIYITIKPYILMDFVYSMSLSLLQFVGPLCINRIIVYLRSTDNQDSSVGYMWASILFVVFFFRSILVVHLTHQNEHIAYRYLYIMEQEIIKKAIKLSSSAKKVVDSGKIISLITADANTIYFFFLYGIFGLNAPLTIILSLGLIIYQIGWVGLIGPVIFIGSLLLQSKLQEKNQHYKNQGLMYSDKRQKYIKEFFQGIRILKYYAWEEIAEKKVQEVREKEAKMIFEMMNLRAFLESIFDITPILISILVFSVYVALGNELNAATTFTVVSLFMIFQIPVRTLTFTYSLYVNAKVSFQRINFFMEAEEIQDNQYDQTLNIQQSEIVVDNCTFKWCSDQSEIYAQKAQKGIFAQKKKLNQKEKRTSLVKQLENNKTGKMLYCFENLSMSVSPGQFVCLVGSVGSGKTTLLNCLLNEYNLVKGRININGKIAFVTQQAWMRNDTIRSNICFGLEYNEQKYNKILDICELNMDLSILPGGDMTEIGERGINLSGGQKQRISIARALYSDADVYLFDDCISALDMHVGPKIFNRAFLEYLSGKTRVLATHALYLLDKFDDIIVLKDLNIVERGSYNNLLSNPNNYLQHLIVGYQKTEKKHQKAKNEEQTIKSRKISENIELKEKSIQQKEEEEEEEEEENDQEIVKETLKEQTKRKEQKGQLVQKEEIRSGSVPLSVYKNYLFGNSFGISFLLVFFFIVSQAFRIFADYWLALWCSNSFEQEGSFYIYIYVGLSFITGISVYFRGFAFAQLVTLSSIRIFKQMLHSLLRSPLWWFDITPLGRILNRCTKDQDEVDYQLPMLMQTAFIQIFQSFSAFLLVSIITPLFLTLFIIIIVLFFLVIKFFLRTNVEVRRVLVVKRAPFYSLLAELLNGIQVIKSYQKQSLFLQLLSHRAEEYHQGVYTQNVVGSWLNVQVNVLSAIVLGGTAYFGVLSKDYNYTSNPALIGLSMTWAFSSVIFIAFACKSLADQEIMISGVQRILDYAENNPQERDFHSPKAPLNWPDQGSVVASDLVYRYRPELPIVLKGVSFESRPCEKLGICGRTGSGKSTLTLGLLRILELEKTNSNNNNINEQQQQGGDDMQIQIVEHNDIQIQSNRYIEYDGKVIEDLGLHELRKKVTIIPQDPVLFSGTLRYNIDPFNDYSDKEVVDALQKAQIWEQIPVSVQTQVEKQTVQNMLSEQDQDNKRLEYIVDEDGQNFSLGQRQLICLARAILRKSKILLMDEATANIDEKTDQIIQNMVKTEFKNCTVITIAHRLNTIITYDRILVLKDGRLAEIDTPANLLNNTKSEFYQMILTQGADYLNRMKLILETHQKNNIL